MERRPLGTTDLWLPAVGLGTHRALDAASKETQSGRRSLIHLALNRDAALFSCVLGAGESDRIVGASLLGHRDSALVLGRVDEPDPHEGIRTIERAIHYFDGWIDLLVVEPPASWPDYQSLIDRLLVEGSIQAAGLHVIDQSTISQANQLAIDGRIAFLTYESSPRKRDCGEIALSLATRHAIGAIAFSPFEGGRLARLHPPSQALNKLPGATSLTFAQLTLKWILSDQRVSAVIPATRRRTHLLENIAIASSPWFSATDRTNYLTAVALLKR